MNHEGVMLLYSLGLVQVFFELKIYNVRISQSMKLIIKMLAFGTVCEVYGNFAKEFPRNINNNNKWQAVFTLQFVL